MGLTEAIPIGYKALINKPTVELVSANKRYLRYGKIHLEAFDLLIDAQIANRNAGPRAIGACEVITTDAENKDMVFYLLDEYAFECLQRYMEHYKEIIEGKDWIDTSKRPQLRRDI